MIDLRDLDKILPDPLDPFKPENYVIDLREEFVSQVRAHAETIRSSVELGRQTGLRELATVLSSLEAIVKWREENPDVMLPTPLTALIHGAGKALGK